MTIPVVVAAGGNGSRIGGDKANQMLDGTSLLQRALIFAQGQSSHVAIAARCTSAIRAPELTPILLDKDQDGGPLSALANALDYASRLGAQSVLMMPCDMPFLPADLLERLKSEGNGARVAMASSGGRYYPICALWPVACRAALPSYAGTSNGSLIGLARLVGFAEILWPDTPFDPFFNINDGDDLAVAERILAQNANA